jgi:hypothetical protein
MVTALALLADFLPLVQVLAFLGMWSLGILTSVLLVRV